MNPFQDIRSRRLLHAKGLLFVVIGAVGCGTVLMEVPTWRMAFALAAGIWGFCRFYYFLFYVLEQYAGRGRRYAGLFDALRYVLTGRNRAAATGETGDVAPEPVPPRGCQCGLWELEPSFLEARGVPRGHCGHCETCGRPGHTRHFPGMVPYTGSWCDLHHRRLSIVHPLGHVGRFLYPGVILVGIVLWTVLRR